MKKCIDCENIFIRPGKNSWCDRHDKYISDVEDDTAEYCEECEEKESD